MYLSLVLTFLRLIGVAPYGAPNYTPSFVCVEQLYSFLVYPTCFPVVVLCCVFALTGIDSVGGASMLRRGQSPFSVLLLCLCLVVRCLVCYLCSRVSIFGFVCLTIPSPHDRGGARGVSSVRYSTVLTGDC